MKEWYSRGYLPHRDKTSLVQHITFHLADSIPQKSRDRLELDMQILESELSKENTDNQTRRHRLAVEKLKRIHELLDAGHGECHLRNPHCAEIVQDTLLKFNGVRYNLKTWCIMPNHVHVLIECNSVSESKILHSWKSYTALAINRALKRNGHFWHREYFDRFVRDKKHLERVIEYIEMNPVKAGFVRKSEDWKFSGLAWNAATLAASGTGKEQEPAGKGAGGPLKHGTPPTWRHRELEKSKNLPARVPAVR